MRFIISIHAFRALFVFIGTTRFELATSATPMQHSTKLSYVPTIPIIVCFFPAPVKWKDKKDSVNFVGLQYMCYNWIIKKRKYIFYVIFYKGNTSGKELILMKTKTLITLLLLIIGLPIMCIGILYIAVFLIYLLRLWYSSNCK